MTGSPNVDKSIRMFFLRYNLSQKPVTVDRCNRIEVHLRHFLDLCGEDYLAAEQRQLLELAATATGWCVGSAGNGWWTSGLTGWICCTSGAPTTRHYGCSPRPGTTGAAVIRGPTSASEGAADQQRFGNEPDSELVLDAIPDCTGNSHDVLGVGAPTVRDGQGVLRGQ
jgi:hypothetical protein